jgi:hypothetical protein
MSDSIELELEVDVDLRSLDQVREGFRWEGDGPYSGIVIDVRSEQGHGFGLTELVDVAIAVGTGVSADFIADAIRAAVKGTIRRVRRKRAGDSAKPASDGELESVIREAQRSQEESGTPS